ncbi:MAG: hypothetical protein ACI9PY_003749, partial [Ascidiaceihabitans sp.]
MTNNILFDPLLPMPVLVALAVVVALGILLAVLRGLRGWSLRSLAAIVVFAALFGPSLQQEDRAPLSDIVILAEDATASQNLSDRANQTRLAADTLAAQIAARPNTEVRRVTVPDGAGDAGTRLLSTLTDALAQEPRGRVAGIVALSDGQVHDGDL